MWANGKAIDPTSSRLHVERHRPGRWPPAISVPSVCCTPLGPTWCPRCSRPSGPRRRRSGRRRQRRPGRRRAGRRTRRRRPGLARRASAMSSSTMAAKSKPLHSPGTSTNSASVCADGEADLLVPVEVEDRVLHGAEAGQGEAGDDRLDPGRQLPGDPGARPRCPWPRTRRPPARRRSRNSAQVSESPARRSSSVSVGGGRGPALDQLPQRRGVVELLGHGRPL